MSSVPFVLEFDDLVSGPVREFLNYSTKIGGDVALIAKLVESLFVTQRSFLAAAAASQKPSDADLAKVIFKFCIHILFDYEGWVSKVN